MIQMVDFVLACKNFPDHPSMLLRVISHESPGETYKEPLAVVKLRTKMNMEDSLDMCLRRHRELLWRHKGDWKRPESNSNGPHSTGLENTSPNSNFQPNI